MDGSRKGKAYLVLGVEASGTRLLTRILMNSGALGEDTHAQSFDVNVPFADSINGPIVWRRSYPHGDSDVDLRSMIIELEMKGWSPHAFVIVRDSIPSINAQAKAECLSTQSELDALKENRRQFSLLFSELYSLGINYNVLTLEGLILDSANVQAWLSTFHGLHTPESFLHIRDVNHKHWLSWQNKNSLNDNVRIAIPLSEFIDKLTILRIKIKKIKGDALAKAEAELLELEKFIEEVTITIDPLMIRRIKELNCDLW